MSAPLTPEQERAAELLAERVPDSIRIVILPDAWRSPLWVGWSLACGAMSAIGIILAAGRMVTFTLDRLFG